jgi:phage-related minor tail protein
MSAVGTVTKLTLIPVLAVNPGAIAFRASELGLTVTNTLISCAARADTDMDETMATLSKVTKTLRLLKFTLRIYF